jgi:hypothetical protein
MGVSGGEVGCGVTVGGTGVSVGETAVGVNGNGVDVGEVQEDNRITAVMKDRKRCMFQIICENKKVGRIAPPHRRIMLRRLVPN